MTKTTIDIAMKLAAPPGSVDMKEASWPEKPDWVSAQAIAVAAPMMNRMAPDSEAVPTSMARSLCHSKRR